MHIFCMYIHYENVNLLCKNSTNIIRKVPTPYMLFIKNQLFITFEYTTKYIEL